MRTALAVGLLSVLILGSACSSESPSLSAPATTSITPVSSPLPQGADMVTLDPAQFKTSIDHRYWPMKPGTKWVYRETAADGTVQAVEVTVTAETRAIQGIRATVVHDMVTEDGELVEDTYDWYAQDVTGNLWYLGEDTKEYEKGKVVSTEGSWESGVDGAQAGVMLPAQPAVGMVYRQEYYQGQAEDAAEVLNLDRVADVPYGKFNHCLETKDYTPLEPNLIEHKFYAQGVGPVLITAGSAGADREELISFSRG